MFSEESLEELIRDHVVREVPLGLYDPNQPRRSRLPVSAFTIEMIEMDPEGVVHVAGPVVLESPEGSVEQYLRVSVPVRGNGVGPEVVASGLRAAYIVVTNPENGACKETAALANA